jgi:hypothetical protein
MDRHYRGISMSVSVSRQDQKVTLSSGSRVGLALAVGFFILMLSFSGVMLWGGMNPPTPVRLDCDRARGDCRIVVREGNPTTVALSQIAGTTITLGQHDRDQQRLNLTVRRGDRAVPQLLCSVQGVSTASAELTPRRAEIDAFLAQRTDRLEMACTRAPVSQREMVKALGLLLASIALLPAFARSAPRSKQVEIDLTGRTVSISESHWLSFSAQNKAPERVRMGPGDTVEVQSVGPFKRPCVVLTASRQSRILMMLSPNEVETVKQALTEPV